MVVDEEERDEVEEAGHKNSPWHLEYQPLKEQVAAKFVTLDIAPVIDYTRPVLFLEYVKEYVIRITTDRGVVERAKLGDHVYCYVGHYSEVSICTGPEDKRVHNCEDEASEGLTGTKPECSVLEIEPRGVVVYEFHQVHAVDEAWVNSKVHHDSCDELGYKYREVQALFTLVKNVKMNSIGL